MASNELPTTLALLTTAESQPMSSPRAGHQSNDNTQALLTI